MDDQSDGRSNAGLYVLGGFAIVVVVVWVFSKWWL